VIGMALDGAVSANFFRFGDEFDLDLNAFELRKAGQPIRLGRIPMELLLLLIEQRGQLVTRERIIERVWGKDVFLDTDNSINAAIRKIRQVLEDDPEQPRFVQTVIGRGYRFIASVTDVGSPAAAPAVAEAQGSQGLIGKKVSHYRVLRLLGGGGMGLVYMAEDLKLGRRVAIKFLPEELADSPTALERLQREARAASALDHPNICSVYHLDEHDGQPFIVMQLLEGQTLREWIETASCLNAAQRTEQLVDLAMQIADGLEAAHEKGTIHRDIKPTNIFVTSQGQAKILDFGVAKLIETVDEAEPASGAGTGKDDVGANPQEAHTEGSLGTSSYLSPEQVQHQPLDARTDLFSFGLVLYEMATGRRAFSGNTAASIREAVLQLPTASPRQLNPEIPAELERIIGKCLEKDPPARYQSAADLRIDLEKLSRLPARPAPRTVRWILGAAAVVALALGVLASTNLGGIRDRLLRRVPEVDSKSVKARPSMAVIGFKNLTEKREQDWLSTALAEMVQADLASGQKLRLIAGENVARMRVDLALPSADTYSADTLGKIRRRLNTDMVVVGSYLAPGDGAGGKVHVNLQVQDAKTGETLAAVSEDGTEKDLAELVSRTGDRVRRTLQVGSVSAGEALQVRTALPENTEAARYYAQGLAQLRAFENLAARDSLLKAVVADPNHALSHAALSETWAILGYDAKSRDEGKKALALSSGLSREEQLSVEGRYRLAVHEWPRAIEIYKMLWEFFPDNLDYGLGLARAQASASFGKESMATIEKLRKSPPPSGDDPRIDLAEASAADKLGDLHREEQAAASAFDKGQRQGARLLTAGALLTRGSALSALGDMQNAVATLNQAQSIFSELGDRQGLGRVLNNLAIIELHHNNLAEAQKHLEQALELFRQTGAQQGMLQALNNLANVFWERGEIARALEVHQQSLKAAREINDKLHEASSLGNIAGLLQLQGKLTEARQTYEESLQLTRAMGDKEGTGMALGNVADLLTRQGDLPEARKAAEEALQLDRQSGVKYLEGYALYQLAAVLVSQGELDAGRARFQESAALRHQVGERDLEAESRLALAQLQLDSGDPSGSESTARAILPVFHDTAATDNEALSYALLANALLIQRKLPEAQQAAAKAKELFPRLKDVASQLQVEMDTAYVSGVNLKSAEAGKSLGVLEAVREKCSRTGYAGLEFEARLRIAKLELQFGKESAARKRLAQLNHDAQAKGFLLVARKASDAITAATSQSH
jgi:eukaryotic-like serine/threonine-protein kinase